MPGWAVPAHGNSIWGQLWGGQGCPHIWGSVGWRDRGVPASGLGAGAAQAICQAEGATDLPQGQDLVMILKKDTMSLVDPLDRSLIHRQPILNIRVWGVGCNNGRSGSQGRAEGWGWLCLGQGKHPCTNLSPLVPPQLLLWLQGQVRGAWGRAQGTGQGMHDASARVSPSRSWPCRDFAFVASDKDTCVLKCHVFHCNVPAKGIAKALHEMCSKVGCRGPGWCGHGQGGSGVGGGTRTLISCRSWLSEL